MQQIEDTQTTWPCELHEVNSSHLGLWIDFRGKPSAQISVDVIYLATSLGWEQVDYLHVRSEADSVLRHDEVDYQDIEDLAIIADDAVNWLNEILEAPGFFFSHLADGLYLQRSTSKATTAKETNGDFAINA